MLFNTYSFIFIFLPIVVAGYFWLTHKRLIIGSKLWIVAASLFFYSYWSIYYLPLLLLSIFINFFVGSAIAEIIPKENTTYSSNKKKITKYLSSRQLLLFGVVFNVGLLGYFKYTDFLLTNLNTIFSFNLPLLHVVLPLGISFFTFTQIAFLVDAYKGKVKEYDLLNYMLFVSYFPHLLAGPILHHAEMMPQFYSRWNWVIRWRNVAHGLFLFSIGLFKKVIIADTFAQWANAGFDTATTLNFFSAWATSLSYTFQLYFDFSGYTDMAIGMSLFFSIKLPVNFNSPYKASDIQDFWRRWHMTLSRFLKDYVYIPLGGNRGSKLHNYFNLFTVFLVGGLWHGASWMFVIWGGLHGIATVIHRVWKDLGFRMSSWLGWFITFNFVNVAWVFFRAKDWGSTIKVLGGMVGAGGLVLPTPLRTRLCFLERFGIIFGDWFGSIEERGYKGILLMFLFAVCVLGAKNSMELNRQIKPTTPYQLIVTGVFLTAVLHLCKISRFIYFQF
ncbi:MAG: MBOAT family protein [Candidatus Omnitrophica bacterium]|nr:MBOAT family protein [Candidatus Omnitrophota bacterium]